MTLELNLPKDLESELVSEAKSKGMSPTDYVLFLLRQRRKRISVSPTTGAELVAYWEREGVIGMRPDITDPQIYVCQLRQQAEYRHS